MLERRCIVCGNLFKTKYVSQIICSENCRVERIKEYWRRRNGKIYRDESLKEYLDKVKSIDPIIGKWKEDNPVTILPGGEITIFGKPKFLGRPRNPPKGS